MLVSADCLVWLVIVEWKIFWLFTTVMLRSTDSPNLCVRSQGVASMRVSFVVKMRDGLDA